MTAPPEAPPEVVPGVYDIPADLYHEDPVPGGSLSSTGARKLLPPSCPALFHFELGQPSVPKPHFEVGTAAHQLVLGDGPELVLVDYPDWRTNAAKEEAAAARAIGAIPLKRPDFEKVHAMADALREHPEAADLLAPGSGAAEQSLFWQDQAAAASGGGPGSTGCARTSSSTTSPRPPPTWTPSRSPSTPTATTCRPPGTSTAPASSGSCRPAASSSSSSRRRPSPTWSPS
ncbi:hypothetical protein GCM10020000_07200 [Streptomyces olivoverticillatus]